jgi:hypothetical protein
MDELASDLGQIKRDLAEEHSKSHRSEKFKTHLGN